MAYTTIDDPGLFFNTVLYTGDGNDGRTVTGVGFQPDWVWLKSRSEAEHHTLNDSVRGANKQLYSHLSYSEATDTDRLQSFDSNGFTLGTDVIVNKNTETFVSWNWKAGGSASSNSDGSITSSVSVNTTAGFSIVSYTGTGSNATVGHGLGASPEVVIVKRRDNARGWRVGGEAIGTTNQFLALDTDVAFDSATTGFKSFSSTTFGIGTSLDWNVSSSTFIAYCFAEKKGYSKFGSYTGNGNADGSFIYTGFAVSWLMMKRTDSAGEWLIYDNKRDPFNLRDTRLEAQDNFADSTGTTKVFDFLSNGFKCRGSDADINASGGTYIYMAFAESPFVNSNGVPNNAR